MALQANQVGHLKCGLCQITLMYAHGAQSVKCAVCNHVTPVQPSTVAPLHPATEAPAAQSGPSSSTGKATQTVVVENPPTLDEQGNEVSPMSIARFISYECGGLLNGGVCFARHLMYTGPSCSGLSWLLP